MADHDEARHCASVAADFTIGREGFTDDDLAALIERERADARAGAEAVRECASKLVAWIHAHGHIENHGHRRPGSACLECTRLNDLEEALGIAPDVRNDG